MKQGIFTVCTNEEIADKVYRMTLSGDVSDITAWGQFVNIKLDGCYLRRPISVCDTSCGMLTIIYKVVGDGTEKMAQIPFRSKLDLLTGLGNGYNTAVSGDKPLLIGGGVGVPPMYGLAKQLREEGKDVTVILGFNSQKDVFYEEQFKKLGCKVFVATADGSYGEKGFVTDVLPMVGDYTYFYTCGPEPMLKAVYNATTTEGQFSFEERMGCGFGACMGCSCKTKYGNKRICKDGPVLYKEEIIW
ncbi:MAG: dihydroorotate dehydrogenase electron transfer subunit [Clostridia bacterium]|nr:dihydroorotate dehydrogenase electron transfer subunit [Clostridia bacterium]